MLAAGRLPFSRSFENGLSIWPCPSRTSTFFSVFFSFLSFGREDILFVGSFPVSFLARDPDPFVPFRTPLLELFSCWRRHFEVPGVGFGKHVFPHKVEGSSRVRPLLSFSLLGLPKPCYLDVLPVWGFWLFAAPLFLGGRRFPPRVFSLRTLTWLVFFS